MREERERLMRQVETKTVALEESRAAQDAMAKKMKLREKRIRELEEERVKLVEEMGVKSQEMALLQQEKDNLYTELKDSRVEVSRLSDAKDSVKRDMARLKSSHAKELEKIQARLKAVKVADQIQKEITAKRSELDNLRSKARRMEEKYETVAREKLMVERDKDSLKSSLARSLLHTTQLTEELEASQAQNSQLQKRIKQLEDALEKEAIKCASSQAQLEQFEQEIATLKLKHQLDLKAEVTEQFSGQAGGQLIHTRRACRRTHSGTAPKH
nr:hypothetical protein BaRGS_033273 [Batillaria attramentaria]